MDFQIRHTRLDDADAIADVLISANEHSFRGLVPPQCFEFTREQSAANWRRTLTRGLEKGWFLDVAELDGKVIGYVLGGPIIDDASRRGELRQISVLPSHQRRGMGRLLVEHVARAFMVLGIRTVHVETLECSPHIGFYEYLGARLIAIRTHDWDGAMLPMCVYRWDDIASLVIEKGPACKARSRVPSAANHRI